MNRFDRKPWHFHSKWTLKLGLFMLTGILALLYGCSHSQKVLMPPPFDLRSYNRIGVIDFTSNIDGDFDQHVTQNFIQAVQSAQPGVRFLELGNQDDVLKSVSHNRLDLEAIKSIGRKFEIDVLVVGRLDISEIRPRVKVHSQLTSVKAEAYVEALLNTKLYEADSGATLWTRSTSGKESVAKLRVSDRGHVGFGVTDPREKYAKFVSDLVYINTTDFRPYYEYRRVSK